MVMILFLMEVGTTSKLRNPIKYWRPQSVYSVWLDFYIILVCFLLFPVLRHWLVIKI